MRDKHNIDRLIVIDIRSLGMFRTYSAYIPTSDPMAMLTGSGYMVNLRTGKIEWHTVLDTMRSAESAWDVPPKFPGLSNAYFQVLELARDKVFNALDR